MSNFPPSVINALAFEEAARLLETSPLKLVMVLFWRPELFEWECQFIADNAYTHMATRPIMADAILSAAEQVPS